MQLNQLNYVVKAGELGSFSLAAAALYVTQPTLSQQVRKLEQELGVQLFVRGAKSVKLTSAGEEFDLYARRILNDMDTLRETMRDIKTCSGGKIKVGGLWIIGYLDILDKINRFCTEYPQVDFSIKIDGSIRLLEMLMARDIDVAILVGSEAMFQEKNIFYEKLLDDRFMLLVSRQNPLSEKASVLLSDLRGEKIIMPPQNSSLHQRLNTLFMQEDITPQIVCESSYSDVNIRLVSANLAIAFCSEAIARYYADEPVVAVPFAPEINRPVYCAALEDMRAYPPIQLFRDHIMSPRTPV